MTARRVKMGLLQHGLAATARILYDAKL